MAYSDRIWIGPRRMACMIFCWTFHTPPGMGLEPGQMAYQAIFIPHLVPVYSHINVSRFQSHSQCEYFCVILFPIPFKLWINHFRANFGFGYERAKSRASSSYFFLFFPIFLSILLFFLFFSNFLLFFLFFSHFTYNKQIFIRDLNILSLFKYVVYRVH